jgi:hypothetical protein
MKFKFPLLVLAVAIASRALAATGPDYVPIYPEVTQFSYAARKLVIKDSAVVTNFFVKGFFNQRQFQFLGIANTAVATGSNTVAAANHDTLKVAASTATASDTIVNLDNGNGFGQLLILFNDSTNGFTFTMPMTQVNAGDATKTNRLNSDWIPVQRGESLWLYNDGYGFREVARPGQSVGAAMNPTDGMLPFRQSAGVFGDSALTNLSASAVAVLHAGTNSIELNGGLHGQLKIHTQTGTAATLTSDDTWIFETGDNGGGGFWFLAKNNWYPGSDGLASVGAVSHRLDAVFPGQVVWGTTGSSETAVTDTAIDFTLNGGDPNSVITQKPGSLWRDTLAGALWFKQSGAGNTGWIPISGTGYWTNSAGTMRLVVTNANAKMMVSADDGAGQGSIEFWTAGTKRWTLNAASFAPESNSDLGTSLKPIQNVYAGPSGYWLADREIFSGTSGPEGVKIAKVGSLFIQTDGVSGSTLWTKVSGAGNTGWEAYLSGGAAGTTIINDSLTIQTNLVVNNNITVKGNAQLTVVNVGSATITNSTSRIMTTTWTAHDSGTNFVADLSLPVLQWMMTTNLNIIHATNGTANFTTSQQKEAQIKVINNSGTNFPVSFPTAWKRFGSVAVTSFTLTNGDWCLIPIQYAGTTTSQTNIDVAVAYKNF